MVKTKTQYGQPLNYNVTPATRTDGQGSALEGDSLGNLKVAVMSGLVTAAYDYIAATYPDTVTEVYTYKTGGSGGTTVATVTVVYTTATKDVLTSVTRS